MDGLIGRFPTDISHIVDKIRGKSADTVSTSDNLLALSSSSGSQQGGTSPVKSFPSKQTSISNKLSNTKSIKAYSKAEKSSPAVASS